MPLYEYSCEQCNFVTESLQNMDENRDVLCENCGGDKTERVLSTFSISYGPTQDFRRGVERAYRVEDMKKDLKENYGIEKISMAKNTANKTFEDTYKDIKDSGTSIKEAMAANQKAREDSKKAKQKKWMEGALKRTSKRNEEKKSKRAKEKKII